MTSLTRLHAARRVVLAALTLRALLWGAAVALLMVVAVAVADVVGDIPRGVRALAPAAAAIAGIALALGLLARTLRRATVPGVALWIEERVPQLGYALVTLAELRGDSADAEPRGALDSRAAAVNWPSAVRGAAGRALLAPAAAVMVALALLAVLPTGARARVLAPRQGDALARATLAGAPANRLTPLVATVVPPAYSGLPTRTVDEPATLPALVGSRITVRGRGGASGLTALLGERPLTVRTMEDEWAVALGMPTKPGALRLRDGRHERWVVLEPRADSAPIVRLAAPARDTVFRTPTGVVPLAADAADDLGLASGAFEYIVSSGEGESFTFRNGTIAPVALRGARRAALRGRLVLDSLALKPGDVVHVRAVARDANAVSGPGVGSSETRTVRVARAGEYDSLAVDAAPPADADKSMISQRMLIVLTEALERRRPRLAREQVVTEARRISADQKRLRKAVGDIVFSRLGSEPTGEHAHSEGDGHEHAAGELDRPLSREELLAAADRATGSGIGEALDFEGDETPVVAVNRPLLEAYNAMWDASRELDIGEPGRALPPMRRALDAIQRARQAERVYLRGRPPAVVVDLAKVRLQGTERGNAAPRQPRAAPDDASTRRAERLARALALLGAEPAGAVDSLLLLRVDALDGAPSLAAALGEALERLRAGQDATTALARARRLAAGEPRTAPGLGAWSGGW